MTNYKKNNRRKNSQRASVIVAVMLCAVSMFGIAMVYRNAVKKQQNVKSLVETEDESESEPEDSEESHTNISLNTSSEKAEENVDSAEDTKEASVVDSSRKTVDEEVYVENIDFSYAENHFNTESYLTWPVQGEVLMEYSMDSPTYFKTLEQYGYSTGMLIQAERGTPVYASADGVVKTVSYTDEYGWIVTVDLGDGYEATYGQLADIRVSEGDEIVTGALIAEVAVPSKFYSLEGDNLYLSMKKDENYVDPLDYLE